MKLAIFKRMMFLAWLALAPFPVVLWYVPYSGFTFHVFTWALALLILAGLLLFSWRARPVRWLLLAMYTAAAAFLAWPSHRAVDRSA
jgi:hypothetical protein